MAIDRTPKQQSTSKGVAGEPQEDVRFATGRDHPSESEHDHTRNKLKGESDRRLQEQSRDPDAPGPSEGAENGLVSSIRTGKPHNG
jgi:hypothetical protein